MTTRYRCTACGNLTRFDVTMTRWMKAFHHYSVGGDLSIEEPIVLHEHLESIECRWCESAANVVEISASDAATAAAADD